MMEEALIEAGLTEKRRTEARLRERAPIQVGMMDRWTGEDRNDPGGPGGGGNDG